MKYYCTQLYVLFLLVLTAAAQGEERLDRGVVAIQTPQGVFTSWRVLPSDADDAVYTLLRDGKPIAALDASAGSNYLDRDGKSDSVYAVEYNGSVSPAATVWKDSFLTLTLDLPDEQTMPDGSTCREMAAVQRQRQRSKRVFGHDVYRRLDAGREKAVAHRFGRQYSIRGALLAVSGLRF